MDTMRNEDFGPPPPHGATATTQERTTTAETARRRLPALLRAIRTDVGILVRQEIDLGKQEVRQIAAEKATGGGLLAGAAILALFVLGFLGLAGAAALALVMPLWAALLIVSGVFLIIALVLLEAGRRAMAAPATPEKTRETVKEDVAWARRRLRR